MIMAILEIKDLYVNIEELKILHDINLEVNEGEIVVVVGANGVGKTTLLRTIMGLQKIEAGKIIFKGVDISSRSTTEISKQGICLVPEGRRLFPELSAKDNLLIGAYSYRKDSKKVEKNLQWIFDLFPVLEKNKDRIASTFSGGEQQMLSIGRGLMSDPVLLIIDELSLGLAPLITGSLLNVIQELNKHGISILLVEQNAKKALEISERGYVIENGRVVLNGPSSMLLANEKVKEAYLGL